MLIKNYLCRGITYLDYENTWRFYFLLAEGTEVMKVTVKKVDGRLKTNYCKSNLHDIKLITNSPFRVPYFQLPRDVKCEIEKEIETELKGKIRLLYRTSCTVEESMLKGYW